MEPLIIYTDGACKGNPGVGGWGAVLYYKHHQKRLYGKVDDTTNNRMELMAVIQSLQCIKRPCPIEIYLDSQYVRQGVLEWMPQWKRQHWHTQSRQPVKNSDLWQQLDALLASPLLQQYPIQWHWVKGHSGDAGNELADTLANLAISQG